ncbi:MAG TPA: siderophore-interacting protein [Candidatus Acidoferrum sp.]|nr:siderophore-interacting protein [Candidatus Acidoferrum sp.]
MATPPPFPDPRPWQLSVAEVEDLTPHLREIRLTGSDLDDFQYVPGQDLALAFVRSDGMTVRRRYTIRRFDRGRRLIDVDVVMHGDGPGMRWAHQVRPGMSVDAIGPRGKITIAAHADWHLFAGDATAAPGVFAMLETLPSKVPAHAYLLITDAGERQPFDPTSRNHEVEWVYGTTPAVRLAATLGDTERLYGHGHAYLAGEVNLVNDLKRLLLSTGWSSDQISPKAYWNQGQANAGNGEPEKRAA